MRILYLGTDPSRYVHAGVLTHYPVIWTVPVQSLDEETLRLCAECTHWMFTSPSAVKHWLALRPNWKCREAFAIGPATAAALSVCCKQAPVATQEGMIALLEEARLEGAVLGWPRSALARPVLGEFLQRQNIRHVAIDLYTTIMQRLEPVPHLEAFDEIVFTSPSTVRAFVQIFGSIPRKKKLTPIGPITNSVLQSHYI